MNELVVPPSPNWYHDGILVCCPDNTVIYGSHRDIVVIKPAPQNEPSEIEVISGAHSDRVTSIAANTLFWDKPEKLFASVAEDRVVRLWNFNTLTQKSMHKGHEKSHCGIVSVSFAGERVISVTEDGYIVVWRLSTDTILCLPNIFGQKVKILCMSTCPHLAWLTAFGLNQGLVIIADLRKTGRVVYKVRGHDHDITSLSWCPSPYNIYNTEDGMKIISEMKHVAKDKHLEKKEKKQNLKKTGLKSLTIVDTGHFETDDNISVISSESRSESPPKITTIINEHHSVEDNGTENPLQTIFAEKCKELQKQLLEIENVSIQAKNIFLNKKNSLEFPIHIENTEPSNEVECGLSQEGNVMIENQETNNETAKEQGMKSPRHKKFVVNKKNPWGNVVFNDSDEEDQQEIQPDPVKKVDNDFLSECLNLKRKIISSKNIDEDKPETDDTVKAQIVPVQDVDVSSSNEYDLFVPDNSIIKGCEETKDCSISSNETSLMEATKKLNLKTPEDFLCLKGNVPKINNLEPYNETNKVMDLLTEVSVKLKSVTIDNSLEYTDGVSLNTNLQNLNLDNSEFKKIVKENDRIKVNVSNDVVTEFEETELKGDLNIINVIDDKTVKDNQEIELVHKGEVVEKIMNKNEDSVISTQINRDYLLASACRAGTVCIWRSLDGRLELQLPKYIKQGNRKKYDKRQQWNSICWATPTLLLTSSQWNELLAWDLLPKMERNIYGKNIIRSRLIHADHNKYIFTIAVPMKVYPEFQEIFDKSECAVKAWTVSMDRWLLCTNIGTDRQTLSSYMTVGGMLSCLTGSRVDPYRVAFGVGDGSIRVWNLSYPHTQSFAMTAFYEKIVNKISALDWHPAKETVLAFATSEGRIGKIDTSSSKSPIIFSNYHRNIVFRIQWGPLPNSSHDKTVYGLYSCSMGELIVHDSAKPHLDPTVINVKDIKITNFCWKADYSLLAVGSRQGCVTILTRNFDPVTTLYMQKKCVHSLEWHPTSTIADAGNSLYSNSLAVATNENVIYIYDLIGQEAGDALSATCNVIILEGHMSSVKSISWCPHVSGRLVSASDDGVARVWDVSTQNIISVYKYYYQSCIPYVMWSPLDADLIIMASKTLNIWRITKNSPENLNKKGKICSRIIKTFKSVATEQHIETGETKPVKSTSRIRSEDKKSKSYMLPSVSKFQNEINSCTATCKLLLKMVNNVSDNNVTSDSSDTSVATPKDEVYSEILKNLQNTDTSDTDSTDSEVYEDAKESDDTDSNLLADPVKLFGDLPGMLSLLDHEQSVHAEKKHWDCHANISLWKGDVAKSIKLIMEADALNPFIISMAPMVSHKLWLEACNKYADKLMEEGNAHYASSYYLVCHQVEKAIIALCQENLYREAVALATCRLPKGNPMINEIFLKWAKHSTHIGNYEVAAQCYIKLGKLNDAAELFNRRSDKESLELAAEIAKKAYNIPLLNALTKKIDIIKQKEDSNVIQEVSSPVVNICESRAEALMKNSNFIVTDKELDV